MKWSVLMNKIMKNSLALLLSICMILGMAAAIPGTVEAENQEYMIHYTYLKSNGGVLGQSVKLEVGKTYTLSYQYAMVKGDYNKELILKVLNCDMGDAIGNIDNYSYSSSEAEGTAKGFSTKTEGNSKRGSATYTFTWNGEQTASILFHTPGGTSKDIEFYFAKMTLYDQSDAGKTNLLQSVDENKSLKGWRHPWTIAGENDTKWTANVSGSDRYTIQMQAYDAQKFAIDHMIHLKSIAMPTDAVFGRIVSLKANTEYTISFRYRNIQGGLNRTAYVKVRNPYASTSRKTYFDSAMTSNPFADVVYDEAKGVVSYTFRNSVAGSYGIGIEFVGATDMYLADFLICEAGTAAEQTKLTRSFNGTGWRGWYREAAGSLWTCTQSSVDLYTAEIMDYNGTVFIDNCGDANEDRVIDVKDVVRTLKYIDADAYTECADFTMDGMCVDANDLKKLRKYLLSGKELQIPPISPVQSETGGADDAAATKRNRIHGLADTVKTKTTAGTTYYVSDNSGNDNNNGTSRETPFKTIRKINELTKNGTIRSGDKVLFRRGSVFRTQEALNLKGGVSYGAYDNKDWAKPIISGSLLNYATQTWEATDIPNVWKLPFDYLDADPGVMTFNSNTMVGARKEALSQLRKNGDYYRAYEADAEDKSLYLYLSYGNPSDCFADIEIGALKVAMKADTKQYNIEIENIDIQYASHFGMHFVFDNFIDIKGCEIGWIGGGYKDSEKVRYGNAIQFWAAAENCSVTDCYIYQVYDAAYTFQGSTSSEAGEFRNMIFQDNLVEYTSMNVEFWADTNYTTSGNGIMTDITISDNILRFAGYGWSAAQRSTRVSQAFLLGWERTYDSGTVRNFNISNNIFDCANCYFVRTEASYLTYSGNTYYQKANFGTTYTKARYGGSYLPIDQSTFESGIREFDSSAASTRWIE